MKKITRIMSENLRIQTVIFRGASLSRTSPVTHSLRHSLTPSHFCSLKDLSRLIQGSFKVLSRFLQGSFKVPSRFLQGSFKVPSRFFQSVFKVLSKLLKSLQFCQIFQSLIQRFFNVQFSMRGFQVQILPEHFEFCLN